MTIRTLWRQLAVLAACVACCLSAQTTSSPQPPQASGSNEGIVSDPGWPRTVVKNGHSLTYYQPQVDEWQDQLKLTGRLALALTPAGAKEPIFGVARVEANTQTDTETRTVYLYNIRLTSIHFPIENSAQQEQIAAHARELFLQPALVISLDRLVAGLQLGESGFHETEVSLDPPKIFFSTTPAVLVMIDGDPVQVDIEKTTLRYVVNTNWDLFFDTPSSSFYLLEKDLWLTAKALEGPWAATKTLPPSFQQLPATDDWAEARKSIPPKSSTQAPAVYVSNEPAELILVDGKPKLDRIAGTQLSYVTNSDSDLFLHYGDRYYYLLIAGRWFRADSAQGPWSSASRDLPDDFAGIPSDHPRGRVLSSVSGTQEAEEAILVASIPQTATLNRSTATAQAEYVGGMPEWKEIPGTPISYAVNTQQDVFRIADAYYLCFQGAWFKATSPDGPWEISESVPPNVSEIPPDNPKHNVTYVNVYNSTPTTVTYGYTAGYVGMFIAAGAVVWGTGYHYPPYWGWGHHPHPVYWPPRYHTWGAAAYYNPYTGAYGRRTIAYGPYGGYGHSAVYNPRTGGYARGSSAWGPGGHAWRAGGYNPRTGTGAVAGGYYDAWSGEYGAGYRGGNQYSRWGEGVVGEGDDWVHAKYRVERGQGGALGIENSDGEKFFGVGNGDNRGFVAKDDDNNVFVGGDDGIYKRDDDGDWHKNVDGDWEKVPKDQIDNARNQAQQRVDQARQQRSQGNSAQATQNSTANSARNRPSSAAGVQPAAATQNRAATTNGNRAATTNGNRAAGTSANRTATTNASRTTQRPASTGNVMRGLEGDASSRRTGAAKSSQHRTWQQSSRSRGTGAARRSGGRRR